MTHKEQRCRRREGVLRVHCLEIKYKKYISRYWYFSNPAWSKWNTELPEEDQHLLMFFNYNKTQKERAILWRNQEFVNIFCNRYLTLFQNVNSKI